MRFSHLVIETNDNFIRFMKFFAGKITCMFFRSIKYDLTRKIGFSVVMYHRKTFF